MSFNKYLIALIAISFAFLSNPVLAGKDKININTANIQVLDKLKGVGPKKAAAIVKYREGFMEANPDSELVFETAMDLTQVRGIGPKTVQKNLDVIIVRDSAPETESEGSETDEEDKQVSLSKEDCITDSQCEGIPELVFLS